LGRNIGNRNDSFFALTPTERKSRIEPRKFIGKMVYASRNELIMLIEQYHYQINEATKLQAAKKLAIRRLGAMTTPTLTAISFSDAKSFDDKLVDLRSQYFESEIR